MVQILFFLFFTLLSIFFCTYLIYFAYLRKCARKLWRLKTDKNFQAKISILIPVHNEQVVIESKLNNIKNVSYPKEKIEVIVADDASQDKTLLKVMRFMTENPELNIKIVKQNPRAGKSATLNKALAISASEIVIVSDADAWWSPDILQRALPYLSDSKVGAITGRAVYRYSDKSWVVDAEDTYLELMSLLRLGESKIYSTIRFEGGFCAYKKEAFEKFDCETGADDSGTALEVVQNGYRAILVPEAVFYTDFPASLAGKLRVKARRANQLIGLWMKSFRLLLRRQLLLPKRIAVPEIMLFIFNPVILLALVVVGLITLILFPLSFFSLALLLHVAVLLLFVRKVFSEVVIDNLVLLYALSGFMFGKRYVAW